MKSILAAILFISATSCAAKNEISLVDYFLNIKGETFYENKNGQPVYNELKAYKAIEKKYIDLVEAARIPQATEKSLKYLLFFGYAAYQRNDAASMEALSSDLMTVYLNNKKNFLTALRDAPTLIPSSCYYLGNYFGFEDKHKGEYEGFYNEQKNSFLEHLNENQTAACFTVMKETAH